MSAKGINIKIKTPCSQCGNELERYPSDLKDGKRVFCNKECSKNYFTGENHPKWTSKKGNCDECGKDIVITSWTKAKKHFCNMDCSRKYYSGTRATRYKVGLILVDCHVCNVAFELQLKDAKKSEKHYCSRICLHRDMTNFVPKGENHPRWSGGLHKRICPTCGKEFTYYACEAKNGKGKYCSVVCGAAPRIKYKNPDERAKMLFRKQELRQSMEYKKWKLSILKRDKKKCINCGSKKELQVHHIVPVSVDIGKAIDINNGQALCFDCHLSVHGKKRVGISA